MSLLPLAEVKAHLSEVVQRVSTQHERVTITVHGRPAAVLISVDDLESLEETIAVTQNFCNSANLLHVCDDMKSPHDADADYLAFKHVMRTVRPDVHERLVEVGAAYAVGLVRRSGPSACT